MINKNEPIFIGGQMKSGTTMLRMMLSQHSNIYSGLETYWFSDDLYINYAKHSNESIDKLKMFYNIDDSEMFNIINHTKKHSGLFINSFFDFILSKESENRWLEKTPDNIRKFSLINECWKGYKFIHVIRDFRDIYASWKLSNKYNINHFINQVEISYSDKQDVLGTKTSKYCEVKYEDLVQNTKREICDLLQFLNEKFEDDCVVLDKKKAESEFDKVYRVSGKKSTTLMSTQKKINNNKIMQYKTVLNKKEIRLIESELSEYMDLFGYDK